MATKEHPNGYFNYGRVMKIVRGCKDFTDFQKNHNGAACAAQRNGWVTDVKAILPHKTYWNRMKCEQEIKDKGYKNKKEFRKGSPGAYSHAYDHGFLDEICKEMETLGHYNLRRIYVYEFEDDYAYVGLSGNLKDRNRWHTSHSDSPVFTHIKASGAKYELKIISEWMSKEDAQVYEDEMIKVYSACGWHMLNRKGGGDLGSAREPKYSLEELKAAVDTCESRKEFKTKYSAMYSFVLYHNLRDEVLGSLPERVVPSVYWNDEKLWDAVKECNYSRRKLQERYPGAYEAINKKDRFIEFFGDEKRKVIRRTPQQVIKESRQYKSLKEMMKQNQGLYYYIHRHHLEEACFKGLVINKEHANYTWHDILACINASRSLTQMRNEHPYEYRAALRKPEWRHELYQRLPSRKHKSNET